jgi:hypothetical protein
MTGALLYKINKSTPRKSLGKRSKHSSTIIPSVRCGFSWGKASPSDWNLCQFDSTLHRNTAFLYKRKKSYHTQLKPGFTLAILSAILCFWWMQMMNSHTKLWSRFPEVNINELKSFKFATFPRPSHTRLFLPQLAMSFLTYTAMGRLFKGGLALTQG